MAIATANMVALIVKHHPAMVYSLLIWTARFRIWLRSAD